MKKNNKAQGNQLKLFRHECIKTCKVCNKLFIAGNGSGVYCSRKCRGFNDPAYRKEIAEELSKIFGYRCWYCGINVKDHYDIDHIIAKSKDGTDNITNLALSCHFCNMAKGDSSLDVFLKYLAYLQSEKYECLIMREVK